MLTAGQARHLGFTATKIRTELRTGRWDRLVRGVYFARGDLPTREDWVRAGLLLGGRGAVVSGWDAVRAYELGSNRPPTQEILVLTRNGTHRLSGRVRLRPSTRPLRAQLVRVAGMGSVAVAGPARAVADTALVYRNLAPVRALVTSAVQLGRCTPDDLRFELEQGPQNGSAHLRRAIEDVFWGAASISEAELADLMRSAGLPLFELNVPIINPAGRHVATADALWRELRAILEVDSKKHHFLEPEWRATMRRHNLLTRHGLVVTHYAPAEFGAHPDQVVREIEEWLKGRAQELGIAYERSTEAPPGRPAPFYLDQQGRTVG